MIYMKHNFFSPQLDIIIIFFFWKVETLYTKYRNHTLNMVAFFHLGRVPKFYKWWHHILGKNLEFYFSQDAKDHFRKQNIELSQTRYVNLYLNKHDGHYFQKNAKSTLLVRIKKIPTNGLPRINLDFLICQDFYLLWFTT